MLSHAHTELENAQYVVFADASRRYVDCSDGVCGLLGYRRAEMLQKTIDDVSYSSNEVPALFAQYLKTGKQEGEYVLRRKDRTPVLIRYQAFVFSDGCKAAVWEPMRDWREPYLAALLELDAVRLKSKIEIAMAAIQQARQSQDPASQTGKAQQEIADALSALHSLRRNLR
jgi:PAS domain-containing protein